MKFGNFFIFLLLISFSSSSQTYVGIDAAINTSHWTLSLNGSSLNYSNSIGWSVGVPVEIYLSKIFDLRTGTRFANKGSTTITFTYNNVKTEPQVMINYIEVPVLLKGKFGSEKIQFNPIGGISTGIGVAGRVDDLVSTGNGFYTTHNRSVDFKNDEINRVNVQLHIGAGSTFILASGEFFFDIQYLHGISNLSLSKTFQNEDSFSVTARGFELSFGYFFRSGKRNTPETPRIK